MKVNKKIVPKKICVLRLSALGDCCQALTVIQNIRDKAPNSKISWIIGETEFQLFKDIDGVEFIVVNKKELFKSYLKMKRSLKGRKFDVLLNMHASMSANLISLAINAKRKIGFDKYRAKDFQSWFCNEYIPEKKNQHVAEGMLEFLNQINISCSRPEWRPINLIPEEDFAKKIINKNKHTCIISPCSSTKSGDNNDRNWSIENYITLIDSIIEKHDIQIILTGGGTQTEKTYSDKFNLKLGKKVLNLIDKTSIREMAALIKYSDFLISPDSGPAHIADIMGKPVIGLYACLNPNRSGSYKSAAWSINKYPEALKKYNRKSLEEANWGQKIKNPDAMNLIKPDEVYAKVEQLISKS